VTEEAAADLPVPEERAVLPLPHAITVANTMSDNAPKTFLIIANISPSLENLCNCWPEVLPVANGHSFADRSGRQGCPKTARDYKTRLLCGCFDRTQQCDEIGVLFQNCFSRRTLQIKFAVHVLGAEKRSRINKATASRMPNS
jgi:hypothetical protein